MNYLAHALLSGNNEEWLIGNFIADHVRGNDFTSFSPGVIEGIYLHRRIDAFTDKHSEFKKAKRLFYQGFEKHSGILVDIYFDHLLAKYFNLYHTAPLKDFSEKVYSVYESNRHLLPQSSGRFLDYVVKNNIYSAYADIKGIETVLYQLSHRIGHKVMLHESLPVFINNENELNSGFREFFREALTQFNFSG